MKLRRLTGNSTVKEALTYLQKRHPLYFMTGKISEEQSVDLLKRLIYRLKQIEEIEKSNTKAAPPKKDENTQPVFKSGKSLPAVVEEAEP